MPAAIIIGVTPCTVGKRRVRAVGQQQAHDFHVTALRRARKRRRARLQHGVRAAVIAQRAQRRHELDLQVRVRAALEHHLDELGAGDRIRKRPIGATACRQRVHVYDCIQRRAAPCSPTR